MKYRFKRQANLLARAMVILLVAPNIAFATNALEYASADELGKMMSRNELSAVSLVEHLSARIATLDKQGPSLNAIIELNPDAIEIAAVLDKERASGQIRGPLHGIPVLLKDNIDTADKMQTSAGSLAMVGQPAANDAFIVKQLREAGAIVLGKTNMSEWANVRDMTLPHGWSGRGGQSKNPHVLSAGVCGSSAGSAVAVAAGFAPLTIGTETNGSITCPATANGVVGVKPTLGLFSRSGIVPITRLQDTPGTLTRTVMDAALMFNALQGADAADAATSDAPDGIDYTGLLAKDALNGKRIGYPIAYAGTNGVPLTHSGEFLKAMITLQEQGATLVPLTIRMPDMDGYFDALMSGVKHELPQYLVSRTGVAVESLQALIDFNRTNPGHEGYGQTMLEAIQASTTTAQEAAAIIETLRASFQEAIDEQLREYNLDALVSEDDGYSQFSAAVAGYPAITLPSGMKDDGMPTSVFFFGTRWSEPQLLAMAYSYEQESAELKHPAFK